MAGNEFDEVIKIIGRALTWIIQSTLNLICFIMLITSMIVPWRFICVINMLCDQHSFKVFKDNYKVKCVKCFFGSLFDLVVMIPACFIGIVTLSRLPLIMNALLCETNNSTDMLSYSWDKRFDIIYFTFRGIGGVIICSCGIVSLAVPSTTQRMLFGLYYHFSLLLKIVILKQNIKIDSQNKLVLIPNEQNIGTIERAYRLLNSLDGYIWSTFVITFCDVLFIPLGFITSFLPTRTYPFYRQVYKLSSKNEAEIKNSSYCYSYSYINRSKLYSVCFRTLFFAIGDCIFVPFGLVAVMIPSRTSILLKQLYQVLLMDPIRAKDMKTGGNGMPLPGEAWLLLFYK